MPSQILKVKRWPEKLLRNGCAGTVPPCSYIVTRVGSLKAARVFQEMCRILGIKKTRSTPLRPQSNGQVERFNRTLGALLSIYTGEQPKLWDRHLPFVLGQHLYVLTKSYIPVPTRSFSK